MPKNIHSDSSICTKVDFLLAFCLILTSVRVYILFATAEHQTPDRDEKLSDDLHIRTHKMLLAQLYNMGPLFYQ